MIIRATNKILNIARIEPVKNESIILSSLPGEWYASLLSTGREVGLAIHFLHNPTMMTVVTMGKSLNRAIKELPTRATSLLMRNGYTELVPHFKLGTMPEIYSTNSRSILANMNQIKFSLEYSFALSDGFEEVDIARIEDTYLTYLVGGKIAKGKYISPVEILKELLEKQAAANTQ
ncbi:MAG: hypothetical protein H6Q15_2367 [Bacteroidetes bacterium]|nr:hypothetical protein [Bacteroidota bacterium]